MVINKRYAMKITLFYDSFVHNPCLNQTMEHYRRNDFCPPQPFLPASLAGAGHFTLSFVSSLKLGIKASFFTLNNVISSQTTGYCYKSNTCLNKITR